MTMLADQVRVAIDFKKRQHEYFSDGSVAVVRQQKNRVNYLIKEPDTKEYFTIRPIPLLDESYDDAKLITFKQLNNTK